MPVRDMLVDGRCRPAMPARWSRRGDPAGAGAADRRRQSLGAAGRGAGPAAGGRRNAAFQAPRPEKDADTLALEKMLSDATGVKVINAQGKGGEMRIAYKSLEQLDDLCRRLQRG
jgi:ParB family transcriptional regulator, chromosome partitioning protein